MTAMLLMEAMEMGQGKWMKKRDERVEKEMRGLEEQKESQTERKKIRRELKKRSIAS